ncbi:MAG: FecCD family ABC transporter permease [Candidatus Limivicinus sp.]
MTLLALAALTALLLGIGVGSVFIPPGQVADILLHSICRLPMPENIDPVYPALIYNMRLPRVLMAFLAGAALSVSGTVMQSVLRNPLASPFGLGVSAGAGLGAALVMVLGLSSGLLGTFLLPVVSLGAAMLTVFLVISFSERLDSNLSNTTIVLVGMVVSLFLNAIMSMLATVSPVNAQRISLWTLGSFSMKEWQQVYVLLPVTLLCILFFCRFSREMDIMSFGEEQAQALGVPLKKMKWMLIAAVAVLTGTATSFVGIIGFVDLISPHVVRRFFGASHRLVIPASALFGGGFMVLCDLAARTLTPPREIPIGSITALIGAPFFIYVFFARRRRK